MAGANQFDQPTGPTRFRDRPSLFVPRQFQPTEVPQEYIPLPLGNISDYLGKAQAKFDEATANTKRARSAIRDFGLTHIDVRGDRQRVEDASLVSQEHQKYRDKLRDISQRLEQGDLSAREELHMLDEHYVNNPVLNYARNRQASHDALQKRVMEAQAKMGPGSGYATLPAEQELYTMQQGRHVGNANAQISEAFDIQKGLNEELENLGIEGGGGAQIVHDENGTYIRDYSGKQLREGKIYNAAINYLQTNPDAQAYLQAQTRNHLFDLARTGQNNQATAGHLPYAVFHENGELNQTATGRNYQNALTHGLGNTEGITRYSFDNNVNLSGLRTRAQEAESGANAENMQGVGTVSVSPFQLSTASPMKQLELFKGPNKVQVVQQALATILTPQQRDAQYNQFRQTLISEGMDQSEVPDRENFDRIAADNLATGGHGAFREAVTGLSNILSEDRSKRELVSTTLDDILDGVRNPFEASLAKTMQNAHSIGGNLITSESKAGKARLNNWRGQLLHNFVPENSMESASDNNDARLELTEHDALDQASMTLTPDYMPAVHGVTAKGTPFFFVMNDQFLSAANTPHFYQELIGSRDNIQHQVGLTLEGGRKMRIMLGDEGVQHFNSLQVNAPMEIPGMGKLSVLNDGTYHMDYVNGSSDTFQNKGNFLASIGQNINLQGPR